MSSRKQVNPLVSIGYQIDGTVVVVHAQWSGRKPYRKRCRSVLPWRVNGNRSCADPDLLKHVRAHVGQQDALGSNLRQMLLQGHPSRMEGNLPFEGIALGNEHIRGSRGFDEHRDPFRVSGIAEGPVLDLTAQRVGRGSGWGSVANFLFQSFSY